MLGAERVETDAAPLMGSEDFAFMLEARPGCYAFIGNGIGSKGGCMVHNPGYDFNDDILAIGASYWFASPKPGSRPDGPSPHRFAPNGGFPHGNVRPFRSPARRSMHAPPRRNAG